MRGRIHVISSNLTSIGWTDENGGILEVEFKNGSIYEYKGVSREVYLALMKSTSKGHFLAVHIKGVYPFRKMVPAKVAPPSAA